MKQKTAIPFLLLVFSFLFFGPFFGLFFGCGAIDPVTNREHLGYFPARIYDMLDILELNVAVDSQASLYAIVAVDPVMVGGGIYDAEKVGMDGRCVGQWSEKRAAIGLGPEAFVRYEKNPNWGNRYLKDAEYAPHKNMVTMMRGDPFYEEWGMNLLIFDHEHRILDVTVEVNVLFLGIDVGVSLLEIADFVFGFLSIDVSSDDEWGAPRPVHQVPFYYNDPETTAEPSGDEAAVINIQDQEKE